MSVVLSHQVGPGKRTQGQKEWSAFPHFMAFNVLRGIALKHSWVPDFPSVPLPGAPHLASGAPASSQQWGLGGVEYGKASTAFPPQDHWVEAGDSCQASVIGGFLQAICRILSTSCVHLWTQHQDPGRQEKLLSLSHYSRFARSGGPSRPRMILVQPQGPPSGLLTSTWTAPSAYNNLMTGASCRNILGSAYKNSSFPT